MTGEKRKYKRFSATAFLKMPVTLTPCPPFFGKPLKGRMIDLSAGGLAILISEIIPMNSKLNLNLRFPDDVVLNGVIQVKRLIPRAGKYLLGMEFVSISYEMRERIVQMSNDYIDCETRIHEAAAPICRAECAFYSMCTKSQRLTTVFDVNVALELAFKMLEESPLVRTPEAIS